MNWSYRILKYKYRGEWKYKFIELYKDDGCFFGYCDADLKDISSKSDAISTLQMMLDDCKKYPVITRDEIKDKEVIEVSFGPSTPFKPI